MKINTKIKKTLLTTGIVGLMSLGLGFGLTNHNHKTNIKENFKISTSQNNNLNSPIVKMEKITFKNLSGTDARIDWFNVNGEQHKASIPGEGFTGLWVAANVGSRFDVQYWRLTDAHYTYAGAKIVIETGSKGYWNTATMTGSAFKCSVNFSLEKN